MTNSEKSLSDIQPSCLEVKSLPKTIYDFLNNNKNQVNLNYVEICAISNDMNIQEIIAERFAA